jgi:hypothetical protein
MPVISTPVFRPGLDAITCPRTTGAARTTPGTAATRSATAS